MLYFLILTDTELSYENHSEDFFIGIFKTKEQAEETAEYYLENVKGFCEYNCTYRIEEKKIYDNFINTIPDKVWVVSGWNVNENYDETDIIESKCFNSKKRAEQELEIMKSRFFRTEWSVDCYKIGQLYWYEGFVRME